MLQVLVVDDAALEEHISHPQNSPDVADDDAYLRLAGGGELGFWSSDTLESTKQGRGVMSRNEERPSSPEDLDEVSAHLLAEAKKVGTDLRQSISEVCVSEDARSGARLQLESRPPSK